MAPLPSRLVEMVIAHLVYDIRAPKARSLACFIPHIAAVPHPPPYLRV